MNKSTLRLSPRKVSRHSLADNVREAFVEAVLDGHFVPGDRLIEASLARDLDVSRGPIREAFRELSELGLLVLTPHRGARVAVLNERDAYEIYSIMAIIERLAFQLAKRRLPEGLLADLREALTVMRAAAERADFLGVARADLQFTDAVFQHAEHRRLQRCWHGLKYQSYLLVRDYASRVYPSLPAVVEHHTRIVDLLENARWDQLLAYLEENSDRIERRLLAPSQIEHIPTGFMP